MFRAPSRKSPGVVLRSPDRLKSMIFGFARDNLPERAESSRVLSLFCSQLSRTSRSEDLGFVEYFFEGNKDPSLRKNSLVRILRRKSQLIRRTGQRRKTEEVEGGERCLICLERVDTEDCVDFNCRHAFHPSCYRRLFFSQDPEQETRCLQCVTRALEEPELGSFLLASDLRFFGSSPPSRKNSRSLQKCLNSDCDYLFEGPEQGTSHHCPTCRHVFCLHCKTSWEEGHDCIEFRDRRDNGDRAAIILAMGPGMRECRRCKLIFEVEERRRVHVRCFCGYRNNFSAYIRR